MDERELIDAARAGTAGAWEALYRSAAPAVYRFARDFQGEDEAEDILQETFLRAFRNLGSYRRESSLRSWLLSIARNAAVDAARSRQKRRRDRDRPLPPVGPADPAGTAAHGELVDALRAALQRLPTDEREAVALYELQEMSSAETAGILGWTEAKVRVTVFRARRKLRDMLEPALGNAECRMKSAE